MRNHGAARTHQGPGRAALSGVGARPGYAASDPARPDGASLAGWRVILVHGVRTSGTMWRHQVAALRARGAEVMALDLPGHGSRSAEVLTLSSAAAAIQEGVDGTDPAAAATANPAPGQPPPARTGRIAVVGLSLGGYLGLHWAARTATPPDLLVLSSCTALTGGLLHQGFRALTAAHGALPGDLSLRAAERWARLAVGAAAAADVSAGGVSVPGQAAALRAMLRAAPLTDLEAVLQRGVPVTFLQGELDHFRLHERRFRQVARGRARWVLIRRAHHLVSLHRPAAYTRALVEELARLAPAT